MSAPSRPSEKTSGSAARAATGSKPAPEQAQEEAVAASAGLGQRVFKEHDQVQTRRPRAASTSLVTIGYVETEDLTLVPARRPDTQAARHSRRRRRCRHSRRCCWSRYPAAPGTPRRRQRRQPMAGRRPRGRTALAGRRSCRVPAFLLGLGNAGPRSSGKAAARRPRAPRWLTFTKTGSARGPAREHKVRPARRPAAALRLSTLLRRRLRPV